MRNIYSSPSLESLTPLVTHRTGVRLTRKRFIAIAAALAIAVIVILCISLLVTGSTKEHAESNSIIPGEPDPPPSERGIFQTASVVSDAVPCAAAGKEILEEKGTAVDAAIATLLCMGVYNAQSMGIGGGFVMTIYNKTTGTVETIDAREVAPGAVTESIFANASRPLVGALSVGVPGELRGYQKAHERHGSLPWKRLFDFAIRLATDGFKASLHLRRSLTAVKKLVAKDEGLRSIYWNKDKNDIIEQGDFVKLPRLAETLKAIAENGSADELYLGETGEKLVADIKKLGGIITMDDLRNYTAVVRNTTMVELKDGLRVHSFPAPGSGAILNFILKVLNGFPWDSKSSQEIDSYQRIIETFKYAYAYKSHLGDPDFTDFSEVLKNLTNPELAEAIRKEITLDKTFDPSHYGVMGPGHYDHGTAHMAVISPDGDAVSVTSTINYWFGAGLLSQSTGIVLNNELDDFTFSKGVTEELPMTANVIEPGKRPLSSMSPAIILNKEGNPILAIGAAGGSRIITGMALVIARTLWWDEDLKDAIDSRRVHHQLIPNKVEYEPGIPENILEGLEKIGHKLDKRGSYGSVVVGIHRNKNNKLISNYDFRKGGSVAGF